jgi:hypothetical protein
MAKALDVIRSADAILAPVPEIELRLPAARRYADSEYEFIGAFPIQRIPLLGFLLCKFDSGL